jgi:aryl carrier-like protein
VKPFPDADVTKMNLYAFTVDHLPRHMIPGHVVLIDKLPQKRSGKLDLDALPQPELHQVDMQLIQQPSDNALHKLLVELWQDVLQVDKVEIDIDLMFLGMDSLKAMMFLNRLNDHIGSYVDIVSLFEAPTIADFSNYLKENYAEQIAYYLDNSHSSEVA